MYELTNVYGDAQLLVFRPVAHAARPRAAADLHPDHRRFLRRRFRPRRSTWPRRSINAARNTGGSIGISIASNVVAHREQFHQARLIENAVPASVQYQDTLHQVTRYFEAQGSAAAQAQQQAVAWIGQEIALQASYLAYVGRFLGPDDDGARGRAARHDPAQGEARRPGAGRALRPRRGPRKRGLEPPRSSNDTAASRMRP